MPLEILPAFKAVNAEPSPAKLPTKESAELLKVTLLEYVPANCPLGKVPVSVAAFTLLNPEPPPLKFPTKLFAVLLSTLTPLNVLAAVNDAPPMFTSALEGVLAPVPPWLIERAVLSPDNDVISEFAPLAAAPKVPRAPAVVLAPVPP